LTRACNTVNLSVVWISDSNVSHERRLRLFVLFQIVTMILSFV